MARSVESLPSNPVTRVRFSARSDILNSILELVCVLCVLPCVVFGGGPDILLTTDLGRPALVLVHSLITPQASDPRACGL